MATTWTPLDSVALTADASTLAFSGISGAYTDLRAVYVVRGTASATVVAPNFRFNGEGSGSTLHSLTGLSGDGSVAWSYRSSSGSMGTEYIYAASAPSGRWSIVTIDLLSYASTSIYKTALVTVTTPDYYVNRAVGLFRSMSAITAISFQGNSGNLLAGSTAHLLGMKGA